MILPLGSLTKKMSDSALRQPKFWTFASYRDKAPEGRKSLFNGFGSRGKQNRFPGRPAAILTGYILAAPVAKLPQRRNLGLDRPQRPSYRLPWNAQVLRFVQGNNKILWEARIKVVLALSSD